jgi:nicotinamidase-related amidase
VLLKRLPATEPAIFSKAFKSLLMGVGLKRDLGPDCLHICVDMQNLFAPGSPWHVPWTTNILPAVTEIARMHPSRIVFTRFIPASEPGKGPGLWARYYERWAEVTLSRNGANLVELVAPLKEFVPPARVLDKHVYSPWTEGGMDQLLHGSGIDTLIVTGGETDVCVLATVLGGIDRGYRVVVVSDALCSSTDRQHDALLALYRERFNEQLEVVMAGEIIERW